MQRRRHAGHAHLHHPGRGHAIKIAERFSGNAVGRHWIYAANQSKIANPDLILATCDPEGTAKAAVIISGVGTSWTRWTTFVSGAYEGQC